MSSNDFPTVIYAAPRNRRIWWVVGVMALLLLIVLLIALRIAFTALPPGTTIAGVTVRMPAEVVVGAEDIADRIANLPVQITTPAGSTTVRASQLGANLVTDGLRQMAQDATGGDAWIERFTGGGTTQLPIDVTVSGGELPEVVNVVSRAPVDGVVTITAERVQVTDPVVGVQVTAQEIREAVSAPVMELAELPAEEWPDPLMIDLEGTEIKPVITQESVDAALAEIDRITSTPIELTAAVVPEDAQTIDGQGLPHREQITLSLSGAELRTLLATETLPDAIQRQRIRIVADTSKPPGPLVEFLDDADVPPDMTVSVQNRSPTPPRTPPAGSGEVGPGGPADQPRLADVSGITGDLVAEVQTPGLEPDIEATIRSIVDAAVAGQTTAEVRGTPINAADPALLGITTPISTYTTYYTAGEGRVTNIHRIAELVDGTLIPPGANYDVNHAVGARTPAGGFVPAGAILEGEFITDVGGGVSQFGTTFFNAMWFAGVDIITHTPHSFWFDRYPAGREATIDYPGVNLELNNNTPYWILIDTAVTADSVTVTFWSTAYFQVQQSIGPREAVPGEDFRITIERVATAPALPDLGLDGFVDNDRFTHTYGAN
ncbi:MAG: VanW family protein [Euzebya sp.]